MKCLDCGYNITSDEVGEHEGHEIVEGFFEEIDMSELLTIISNKIYSEFLSPNLVDHPMDVMNVPFNLERADRVAKEILAKFKGWKSPKEVEEAIKQEREKIIDCALQTIAEEPEFPGEMPDELWQPLTGILNNKADVAQVLSNVVKLTKREITNRLLEALKDKP